MLAELRKSGGDVAYETEALGLEQDAAGVRVRLRSNDVERTVRATYVVGADGAHSVVRHLLGAAFVGAEYRETFILADIETRGDLPADEMQLCPHETGALACFPMSASRRRIVAMVDLEHSADPDLPLVQELLKRHGLGQLQATKLIWGSRFKIHHRQTPHMRDGRVFLAGDAAHIHSPFGAQGMNTGLQDAWNLAWKLRLALGGRATETLLDSYSSERHAVAHQVIRLTDNLTKAMASRNEIAQAIRNRAIPLLTRMDSFRRLFVQTLSELSVGYAHSPIVEGKGARAVDAPIVAANATRLYQRLGDRFVLLLPRAHAPDFEALVARFGAAVIEVAERAGNEGAQLVRPDGYVAFESKNASDREARAVAAVLEKQLRT